jgi:hypothetical protein
MALSLLFIRGSSYPFDATQFFLPYLFTTIPSIFFVSALAVFAEVIAGRYSILQNVGFFILFIVIINIANSSDSISLRAFDVLGTRQLTDEIAGVLRNNYARPQANVSVGFIFDDSQTRYFLFSGSHWPVTFILSRLAWMGMAILLIIISIPFFHRFDMNDTRISKKKKKYAEAKEPELPLIDLDLSKLAVASPEYSIIPFIRTEFLMLLRKGPRWFWLVNLGGFVALCFMPLETACQVGVPLMWFLQINRWCDIATKEKYYRTHFFTYSA